MCFFNTISTIDCNESLAYLAPVNYNAILAVSANVGAKSLLKNTKAGPRLKRDERRASMA